MHHGKKEKKRKEKIKAISLPRSPRASYPVPHNVPPRLWYLVRLCLDQYKHGKPRLQGLTNNSGDMAGGGRTPKDTEGDEKRGPLILPCQLKEPGIDAIW